MAAAWTPTNARAMAAPIRAFRSATTGFDAASASRTLGRISKQSAFIGGVLR
jgi:hypothetical protein